MPNGISCANCAGLHFLSVMTKVEQLENKGADYSDRTGATCPVCGVRMPVYNTKEWNGDYPNPVSQV